ncbi:hypothetical protein [Methylobacterium sp. Leaf106]|uniref:hypothetical protein n=1 Tax=Methylobacterium sp. Leaf106 TaxID=1736255 RepID=UPI0006F61F40|nr:hypothetical protein [Methylobacterium sp. Leaf106]KQP53064.1 hypothetical protein ASF34_01465 [Methylobacterium sp. Leaf106]
MAERLNLTDAEVEWLRANASSNSVADGLIRQYQMVVACSQDPGARGVFAAMLDDWRRTRPALAKAEA